MAEANLTASSNIKSTLLPAQVLQSHFRSMAEQNQDLSAYLSAILAMAPSDNPALLRVIELADDRLGDWEHYYAMGRLLGIDPSTGNEVNHG